MYWSMQTTPLQVARCIKVNQSTIRRRLSQILSKLKILIKMQLSSKQRPHFYYKKVWASIVDI